MIAKVKNNEKLERLAKAFNNRRHDAILFDWDSCELHGGYWDGGSRSSYSLYTLATGRITPLSYPTTPPQFGGGSPPTVEIEPGTFVVQHGIFRGKKAHLTIIGPGATETFGITEA